MTSLHRIVIAAGLSGAVFAAPVLAQTRQAVPRGAVSRGDGGGSRGAGGGSRGAVSRGDGGGSRGGEARAPQRDSPRAESPRPESQRAETPRAAAPERSRGTDDAGRVRVPASRRDEDRGERIGFGRPAPVDRGDRTSTTAPVATPAETPRTTRSDTPVTNPGANTQSTVVPRWPTRDSEPRRSDAAASAAATTTASDEEQRRAGGGRQAVPRSRPRGDNPAIGRAVPRDGGRDGGGVRGGSIGSRAGRGVYIAPRGRTTYNYYYYPRRYYPYGYGAFGLGYFYYDPYAWGYSDPFGYRSYRYYGGGHYGGGHYGGYYGGGYYGGSQYGGYYTGELRLRVTPRHAEVYVDGYFAGHVDDFDGILQGLRLEEGPYKIEIVAPGYEPLEFDIRIQPGRKITYRGDLRPRP